MTEWQRSSQLVSPNQVLHKHAYTLYIVIFLLCTDVYLCFCRTVKFISTDWQRAINTVPAGTATYQYQFATSVVHPLRVWALFYPLVDYTNSGATPTESLFHPSYAPGVQCALFTQTNLLVNNVPYFRQSQSCIVHLFKPSKENMCV